LRAAEPSISSNQTNAIQYLTSQTIDETPFIAQRVIALAGTGTNTSDDVNTLLSRQNGDGGWGTSTDFQSDNLDTSFAVMALEAAHTTNTSAILNGETYLIANQDQTSGGWALVKGEDSQVYYTAIALQGLNAGQSQFPYLINTAQTAAINFLHNHQNADAGYGTLASTPFETAATLIGINGTGAAPSVNETHAIDYLNASQQSDGSWAEDPYSTALAILALTPSPITHANQAPTFTSQPVTTASEGSPYSYQAQGADPDNDPFSFTLVQGPSNMTLSGSGLVQWTPVAQATNSIVILKVTDSMGAFNYQEYSLHILAQGIDLSPTIVDTTSVTTDTGTLIATGNVQVKVQNKGASVFDGSFNVLCFEDRNSNGVLDNGDITLGTERFTGTIASNGIATVTAPISGIVQFRDDVIYAFVDSGNEISELDETNNYGNSGSTSKYQPTPGDDQPKVKWQYDMAGATVNHPPIVAPLIDTNGDGKIDQRDVPAVIIVPIFVNSNGPGIDAPIALRGDTGEVIFAGTRSGVRSLGDGNVTSVAVGDLDGDGKPEILVNSPYNTNVLYCFNNDGTLHWTSPKFNLPDTSITIVDLDGDGKSEIIDGGDTCFNFDGTLRWQRPAAAPIEYYGGNATNVAPTIADLDLDGKQEIVLGARAVDSNGQNLWYWMNFGSNVRGVLDRGATTMTLPSDSPLGEAYTAVANLDDDPYPEIIVIPKPFFGGNAWNSVWILGHDGRIKAGPIHLSQSIFNGPSMPLGQVTVADFDGDGQPEIAIPVLRNMGGNATASDYSRSIINIYKFRNNTLELQWSRDLRWPGAGQVPAVISAYDFDGDGAAEAVCMDGNKLYVLDGKTGASRYELAVDFVNNASDNLYPTIADVDNDGVAEIVVPTSATYTTGAPLRSGVMVIGDTKGNWRNSRRIWNQWAYDITNVNENASIPAQPKNVWQTFNTYRAQTNADDFDHLAAPDLTVSRVTINSQTCPASAGITARIGNGGSLFAGAGIPVNFYLGDPSAGGVLIGTKKTSRLLMPGEFEDVTLSWSAPSLGTVFATVNDAPTSTLVGSSNLSLLPNTWAQTGGWYSQSIVQFDNAAFAGIDGLTNTFWSDQNSISNGPHYFEVRFPSPVNASSVSIQNGALSTTGFLSGTLSFSNGYTQYVTLNENGSGSVSFPEQQNISWVRLTATTTKANGASLTEFIVGGSYAEPLFRINEGRGRLQNNKAASSFSVSACDAGGNRPPQIISAPIISASTNNLYTYQVQAVDPNNDPLSFAVTGPAGMTINNTGLISWTPAPDQTGSIPVVIQVSDGRGGIAQQPYDVAIPLSPTNHAPQIMSMPPSSISIGQSYQYDVGASDADGDVLIYSLLQAPSGANIDHFTGHLSWPGSSQALPQFFAVEVQDGKGGKAAQSFFVAVNEIADPLPPSTLPAGSVTCSIFPDKRAYTSNSAVQLRTTVRNESDAIDMLGLQGLITIAAPNSENLFNATNAFNTLFPHALLKGAAAFGTRTNAPGIYVATLNVVYGQQSVCISQIPFSIRSSAVAGVALTGSIHVATASVQKPALENFNYEVMNIGNVSLNDLNLNTLLVSLDSNAAVQTFSDQSPLPIGQSFTNNRTLDTSNIVAGNYLLVLQGLTGGATQTIASTPLTITGSSKAPATISLGNLSFVYDGTPKSATPMTNPAGLSGVTITYDGSTTPPTNAGSYAVVASLTSDNYEAANATGTLVISKATPAFDVHAGTSTYDGTTHSATATAHGGAGETLTVTLTYSGTNSTTYGPTALPPTNAGSYQVVAHTDGDGNNSSGDSRPISLDINKASQTISFGTLPNKYIGNGSALVNASAGSGDAVILTTTTPAVCHTGGPNGSNILFLSIGTCTVKASEDGNGNYNAASDVYQSFMVLIDPSDIVLDLSGHSLNNFDCARDLISANVTDHVTGMPISGIAVTLAIGAQSITAITDTAGKVSGNIILNQPTGAAAASATYAGDGIVHANVFVSQNVIITGDSFVGPASGSTSLYTGSLYFWTSSSSSTTATLTLSASVRDLGPCFGDITKAKVSFLISTGGAFSPVSNAQNLPVGLVNPNDRTVGTASAIVQYDIGKSQSTTLIVRVLVGGEYNMSSSEYDLPVTIGKPGTANSLMGGGSFNNDGSPFLANGYLGLNSINTSFGSQVQYNKGGTNPQGQVTVYIVSCNRSDGTVEPNCDQRTPNKWHTYFGKSNSISNLTLQSGSATFSSKTNVYEQLADGTRLGLDGGGLMQVVFTPYGQTIPRDMWITGTSYVNPNGVCTNQQGCASVVLFRSMGGVWYSSSWGQGAGTTAPHTYMKRVLNGNVILQ
jgi:hypothetical protein